MTEKGFKRKLTAILSADVEGYSRLMGDDEEATVRTITDYRGVMATLIQQHNGKVLDSPGDNLLAEFVSVVDAVQCAVAVQKEINARNTELPENRKMQFRIGINLGDVIQEEERIYGDGVNIAARLEGLADSGGICISKTAFDHIESKLPYGYEFLGDQTVKNIAKPVGAYRVLLDPRITVAGEKEKAKIVPFWRKKANLAGGITLVVMIMVAVIWNFYFRPPPMEVASVEKMAFPLPEKPSIAVLPFNNLSGDSAQDYIADGISENIISALSKISEMFVIARNSTFTYKGKPVKVQQVSEELGVRYVLEGSAQKIGNRLRITAQLIDATTGHHLWSEKYDRDMKDLFALQDEIAHKIIVELQVKLTEGEQARISHKSTTNLEAWSNAVRGLKLFEDTSKENNAKAMELFERAVQLDPGYVWAWVRLAWTHVVAMKPGWGQSPSEHFKKAVEITQKALVLDESDSDVRALLGLVYLIQRQYEQAIIEGEKALVLGPTNAQAHVLLAVTMDDVGRFDDAIELVKRAMRLHPYYPAYYLQWLGTAYRMAGLYENALTVYKQLLGRSKKGEFPSLPVHLFLADVYVELGREEEAQTHVAEVLRLKPEFSLEEVSNMTTFGFKDPAHVERRLNALRKAGIPDNPPLPLPDKPSIAVLAFDNLSGDPEQEYFSDGMAEDIITALSKTPKMFVIARNSSFTYKGKPVKVQQIGRELGVRYVLEGSVRKTEGKVRITAQLIDAKTGHHLWAERYDRDLKDIFDIQDEITKKIITALMVHLTEGEYARILDRQTHNIQAFMKILEGSGYFGEDKYSEGMKCFEEAISLDPQSAIAHGWLSWAHLMNVWFGPSATHKQSIKKAFEFAEKCKDLDPTHGGCYGALSIAYLMKRDYDKAISEGKRSVELGPNNSKWAVNYGWALRSVGRYEDALLEYERALRLNPLDKARPLEHICTTYNMLRRHEEAIETCKKVIELTPRSLPSYINLAVAYSELDQMEDAREAADKILKIYPNLSMDSFEKTLPYKNKADRDLYVNGLRKAGLK